MLELACIYNKKILHRENVDVTNFFFVNVRKYEVNRLELWRLEISFEMQIAFEICNSNTNFWLKTLGNIKKIKLKPFLLLGLIIN